MKSICIITSRYPTNVDRTAQVFVQQLAWSIADMGIQVFIICPLPSNLNRKFLTIPDETVEETGKGVVNLYFPKFVGLGQVNMFLFNTARLTTTHFMKSVNAVIEKLPQKPDAIYGHFITPSGITAAKMGEKYNIPSFLAYGESSPWTIEHYGLKKVIKELSPISGIVAVSTNNKNTLINMGIASEDKIKVFPNGIREELFYKRDRTESRRKFGFPQEAFIVCFVGHFIKRKGIDKLIKAVNELDHIYAAYAGKGKIVPQSEKCLFAGLINHSDLPDFYSAADVFVLPTMNEGCCNAIIEAMACGLPIISSDLPFNDDILDDTCSIRINSNDVNQLKDAIQKLKNNMELREQLSAGSLEKAKYLTLSMRARNIIDFVNEKANSYKFDAGDRDG